MNAPRPMNRRALQMTLAIAGTFALPVVLPWGQGWLSLLISAPAAILLSFAATSVFVRRDADYLKRMAAFGAPAWDVLLNGVTLGSVSDAEYAAMQRCASRDGRVLSQQVSNAGRVLLCAVSQLFTAIPLAAFWGSLAMAAFLPETFTGLVQAIGQADAASMTSAARSLLQTLHPIALLTLFAMVLLGVRFGFRNCYAQAVQQALRVRFGLAPGGDVVVRRVTSNIGNAGAGAGTGGKVG